MPSFFVVLVETEFEESIGFVARAMKNFGLKQLRLVNSIAETSSVARSRAGHAQDIMDNIEMHSSLIHAVKDADVTIGTTAQVSHSTCTLLRRPISPRQLSDVLYHTEGNVALVFGREGTGLTNEELGICDVVVTIPASSEYGTMNLSHAAAILMYEIFQTSRIDSETELLASQATKQKILDLMSELAISSGIKEYKVGIAVKALRNILGRSAVRGREASVLAGTLRKIAETKIDTPNIETNQARINKKITVEQSEEHS
jgi:TrmH family RNA methyltransferase